MGTHTCHSNEAVAVFKDYVVSGDTGGVCGCWVGSQRPNAGPHAENVLWPHL